MSSPSLRREVLSSFKKLHRVSQSVFGSNAQALESARKEINDGYRKNINVTEASSITELIKFAHDVAHELKVSVVELKPTGPGRYSMSAFLLKETEKEVEWKYTSIQVEAVARINPYRSSPSVTAAVCRYDRTYMEGDKMKLALCEMWLDALLVKRQKLLPKLGTTWLESHL